MESLNEGERLHLREVHTLVKDDPSVVIAREALKNAATSDTRRAAEENLKNAFKEAMINADPSIKPTLEKLHSDIGNSGNTGQSNHPNLLQNPLGNQFREAAEKGDPKAQYDLGMSYATGGGADKDLEQATNWLRKAAMQDYLDAQLALGALLCQPNVGTIGKQVEGVQWLKKASSQNQPLSSFSLTQKRSMMMAQYLLGTCYEDGIGVRSNPQEAAKLYRQAADQGLAEAQTSLGKCYLQGIGVAKDSPEAAKWFQKAAENGETEAQFCLGNCFINGDGVTTNPWEAFRWFQKAADQGHGQASHNLAVCYQNGSGVPQNLEEAAKWYQKAVELGCKSSKELAAVKTAISVTDANPIYDGPSSWAVVQDVFKKERTVSMHGYTADPVIAPTLIAIKRWPSRSSVVDGTVPQKTKVFPIRLEFKSGDHIDSYFYKDDFGDWVSITDKKDPSQ